MAAINPATRADAGDGAGHVWNGAVAQALVFALALCSVPDQATVPAEAVRVLTPDGQVLSWSTFGADTGQVGNSIHSSFPQRVSGTQCPSAAAGPRSVAHRRISRAAMNPPPRQVLARSGGCQVVTEVGMRAVPRRFCGYGPTPHASGAFMSGQ